MKIEKLKCHFIHIPKTAGTSIFRFLNRYCSDEEKLMYNKNPHAVQNISENLFKFCFVRNPWDRFISSYFYFKEYGQGFGYDTHTGEIINRFKDFDDFVLNFTSVQTEFRCPHFKNQTHWIRGNNIDFIGRVENLENDFNYVCNVIGIGESNLPRRNASSHNQYHEYFNRRTKEMVRELYEDDIETFNYKFDI